MLITWRWKIREGIWEEVISRLKRNDKKEYSMQRFWGEAEEIVSTKARRLISLGPLGQRNCWKKVRSENKADVGPSRDRHFIETANENPNPDGSSHLFASLPCSRHTSVTWYFSPRFIMMHLLRNHCLWYWANSFLSMLTALSYKDPNRRGTKPKRLLGRM